MPPSADCNIAGLQFLELLESSFIRTLHEL